MFTLSITHLLSFMKDGYIQKGDIIFVFSPCRTGTFANLLTKAGQKVLGEHTFIHDDMHLHTATHVGIVTETIFFDHKFSLTVAESKPPNTCISTLVEFLCKSSNKQFIVFRSKRPRFAALLGDYASSIANKSIPYFNPFANIHSAMSQKADSLPINIPKSFNCSSFVSFIYDYTSYYERISTPLLGFSKISPKKLYKIFREKENAGLDWYRVAKLV